MASFAAGNVAHYWLCLRRASDGSPRNCTDAGSGSYRIEPQGDARVLRLDGLPAAAAALSYHRIFVEREGQVWHGSRGRLQTTHQLRLNQVASGALQRVSIAADTNLCAGLHDTTKPDSEQLGGLVATARLSADGQVLTVTSPGEPDTRLRRISKCVRLARGPAAPAPATQPPRCRRPRPT